MLTRRLKQNVLLGKTNAKLRPHWRLFLFFGPVLRLPKITHTQRGACEKYFARKFYQTEEKEMAKPTVSLPRPCHYFNGFTKALFSLR